MKIDQINALFSRLKDLESMQVDIEKEAKSIKIKLLREVPPNSVKGIVKHLCFTRPVVSYGKAVNMIEVQFPKLKDPIEKILKESTSILEVHKLSTIKD